MNTVIAALGIFFLFLVNLSAQEPINRNPVDNDLFSQIAEHYKYDQTLPLESKVIGTWPHRTPYVIEKIQYQSIHGEQVPGFFAHPKDTTGVRYPTVLLMHGHNGFWGKNEDWSLEWMDIIARSNRCVLVIDNFTYGERKESSAEFWEQPPYAQRDWVIQAVTDQRRGIDYLFTRAEVDTNKIGILGGSMGGILGVLVSGLDTRLATAVFTVSGAWPREAATDDPLIRYTHTLNFAPRISTSVLMVNATGDGREPGEELFKAMPEPKKHVWYESDHYLPPKKYNSDIMAWLDQHLR